VDTIKSVVDALHVGWLGMGAVTQAFEAGIAKYLGLRDRHVLATNTGPRRCTWACWRRRGAR
jgi:dTDP-4-amino-4,6-dideoxygalactose transaminase